MATMLKHVRAKVPPPRHASKETAKVILMGLRKDRSKRIQTAGRFAELIGSCIGYLRAVKEGREISRVNPLPSGSATVTGNTPMPTPHSRGTSGMSPITGNVAGPSTSSAPAEERHGRTIAIVLGLAAIALVLLMVFGNFGATSGKRADDDAPATDKKPKDEPAAADGNDLQLPNNRALVQTNVNGAQVYVDDVYKCDTPCQIEVPVGDGLTHEIRVKKDGHVDAVQYWQPKNVGEPLPPFKPMEKL